MAEIPKENPPAVAALSFKDLINYFPREIRDNVYAAYFQPPEDNYLHPQATELRSAVIGVRSTDPALFEEILFTVKRISSKSQQVFLNSKHSYSAEFEGFPKQIITMHDWLSIQYLVIKVVYYDCSVRKKSASDITQSVCLSIPNDMGKGWNRIKAIQNDNEHLGQLTKIRFDMVYDNSHAGDDDLRQAAGDPNVPFDLAWMAHVQKDSNHVIPLSDLISAFPLANNVWAEPCGSIENHRAMQTIRAFNIGRRVFHRCNPGDGVLKLTAAMAAKGKTIQAFESAENGEEGKKRAKEAAKFLGVIKKEDWMVKNKINFEVLCHGCQAKFRGDREVAFYPEERCLTKRLYKEHQQRSRVNHGANGPCA